MQDRLLAPLVKCEKTDLTKEEIKKKYRISFDKVILYVGSIKQLKSPCTLLKAFESLPDAFCEELNLGLVMAGDGDMRREMEEKYGANSRIMFMGWVRNEDVKELYAVADLYVMRGHRYLCWRPCLMASAVWGAMWRGSMP